MASMKHFFITGLPRSRTAWLANLLTTDKTLCLHEGLMKCAGVDDPHYGLHYHPGYEAVGDCGASLAPHWVALNERFPDAQWVVVRRNIEDVRESHARAFPELPPVPASITDELDALVQAIPVERLLVIGYSHLDNIDTCAYLFQHCTGLRPDRQRIKLLQDLRVTVLADKAYQSLSAPVKAACARSYKQEVTPKSQQWMDLMAEVLAGHPEAYQWLCEVCDVAMTWDHIIDGDPIDTEVATRAFEATLFHWPYNPFWQRNAASLTPVLSNAVAAWKSGNRLKEFDLYSELPCAVAYLVGGRPLVEAYSPRIRKLTDELIAEDNLKDNQT
jgi:hypothetical protein